MYGRIALALLVIAACKQDEAGEPASQGEAAGSASTLGQPPLSPLDDRPIDGGAPRFERAAFSRTAIPPALEIAGDVVGGLRWTDTNGDNIVVLSAVREERDGLRSVHLRADHAVSAGGETRVLRTVRDKEQSCDFDLIGGFIDESLAVTDLDGDEIGEATFAYELSCTSDVSPSTLKLVVLENGDKYIIRGTTRIQDMGDEVIGGDKHVDAAFDTGPTAFRAHADRMWEHIVIRM